MCVTDLRPNPVFSKYQSLAVHGYATEEIGAREQRPPRDMFGQRSKETASCHKPPNNEAAESRSYPNLLRIFFGLD